MDIFGCTVSRDLNANCTMVLSEDSLLDLKSEVWVLSPAVESKPVHPVHPASVVWNFSQPESVGVTRKTVTDELPDPAPLS